MPFASCSQAICRQGCSPCNSRQPETTVNYSQPILLPTPNHGLPLKAARLLQSERSSVLQVPEGPATEQACSSKHGLLFSPQSSISGLQPKQHSNWPLLSITLDPQPAAVPASLVDSFASPAHTKLLSELTPAATPFLARLIGSSSLACIQRHDQLVVPDPPRAPGHCRYRCALSFHGASAFCALIVVADISLLHHPGCTSKLSRVDAAFHHQLLDTVWQNSNRQSHLAPEPHTDQSPKLIRRPLCPSHCLHRSVGEEYPLTSDDSAAIEETVAAWRSTSAIFPGTPLLRPFVNAVVLILS